MPSFLSFLLFTTQSCNFGAKHLNELVSFTSIFSFAQSSDLQELYLSLMVFLAIHHVKQAFGKLEAFDSSIMGRVQKTGPTGKKKKKEMKKERDEEEEKKKKKKKKNKRRGIKSAVWMIFLFLFLFLAHPSAVSFLFFILLFLLFSSFFSFFSSFFSFFSFFFFFFLFFLSSLFSRQGGSFFAVKTLI